MTTYTVISNSGEVIGTGLSVADALAGVLAWDGQEYAICRVGNVFELWSRQKVANKDWAPTEVYSYETDRGAAEAEIFAKVIAADWPRHPSVVTDEQYAEMQAETVTGARTK